MRPSALVAVLLVLCAGNAAAKEWGDVRRPTPAPTQLIGGPANGCIAGAQALPVDGPGYQAVRLSRNRIWSHPQTIGYVQKLGRAAAGLGLPPLYVGDLSQPRGGPMAFGHAAHQNGNDVDIWFNIEPKPDLAPAAREDIAIVDLVAADERTVDRSVWKPRHAELLRTAAGFPEVDRIFVHFAIKKELCASAAGDRSWLRKIRPWRGHNDHFHVRLACPPGNPDCATQSPIAAGDGCDASLDWWFLDAEERRRLEPRPKVQAPPRPKMPAACAAVLKAP
ncbi:MAG: penicillin-insensitive murein endopeptidase [Proteobacteria bacterium]|nr:penicillin-insensitive murein endopeptidase [Pseudomonadota bacterium]